VVIGVGWAPPRCQKCSDEAWAEWLEAFHLRYEEAHGSRYPRHGYDLTHLREAFDHIGA